MLAIVTPITTTSVLLLFFSILYSELSIVLTHSGKIHLKKRRKERKRKRKDPLIWATLRIKPGENLI